MNQISATKIGNTVNLSINGKLYKKSCSTADESKKLYQLIIDTKDDLTDDNLNKIYGYLNEKTRIAMECGLETDPASGRVYLGKFNTPVPLTLIEVIKDYHDNGYDLNPIINFWTLLMINEDVRIRNTLFDFIKTHDFVITDNGYMVAYKAVYYKERDVNSLSEFITNQYLHIKKDWKCSANKYMIYRLLEDDSLHITKKTTAKKWDEEERNVTLLGLVGDMFNDIDKYIENDKTVYTDMHTRTMDIQLGVPVKQARKHCDANPAIDCSNGLHVGATKYVSRFGNKNGAVLVCLINPANVVAVPEYDHSKMRVDEYYPMAIADYDGNTIDIIEQKYFESDYTQYEEKDLALMIENVLNNESPKLDTPMNAVEDTRDLNELQKIIEKRMVDIDNF